FTQEKHQQTHSTFQNLLPPKAAGIAMALNVLGKQFDKLLNVTLCYPDNNRQPFFDMLSGKLTRIVVHVDLQPIADELHGDYINDKSFKRHFQQWLNSLWQEKDRLLTSLMSSLRQNK
ncbi:TPA: acyltransferase, partial [Shigella sonnei]|nr:acyltransferase [Shigella sonnei]